MLLLYHRLYICTVSVFPMDKGYLLYYNVAFYILGQPEEEYSLIWKAKPLTIQIDKCKW